MKTLSIVLGILLVIGKGIEGVGIGIYQTGAAVASLDGPVTAISKGAKQSVTLAKKIPKAAVWLIK